MLRLCIIDDKHKDAVELEKQLKNSNLTCVSWNESKSLSFPTKNETTGHFFNYNEQFSRIYTCVCKEWKSFDFLLLDWSLFGNKDEGDNAISIAVLQRLFDKHPFCRETIKGEKKFIIIVTGKIIRDVSYSFEEIDNKILRIDKPSIEDSEISKAYCKCSEGIFKRPCGLYNTPQLKCNRNSCLPQIINTINLIMEDNNEQTFSVNV